MNGSNVSDNEIERLISLWSKGDVKVENELIQLLYPHIHKIAHFQLKSKKPDAMQTTEIVNEAFIKLYNKKEQVWESKTHFLAIAAKVIRAVIIDQYRATSSQKRGGLEQHLTFDRVSEVINETSLVSLNWIELDNLITELKKIDHEASQVVEFKVFGGMTIPEMAEVMRVSESTVSRNWKFARTWILLQLN